MSLLGKPIEEVIETLYNSIKSKRQIINNIKNEYNINNDKFNEIKINRLKLIDLLDEFEVTISQSLQAIQTLKVEIFNIKEKQTTEEILNLTNELQMKYTTNENTNHNNNNNNNNNIFEKLEYSKTERSIIEPNENLKKNFENNNKEFNFQNTNKNIEPTNNRNNYMRDINILSEAKLNFDYSNLLNSSELSLKNSIPNLDKYRINHNEENIDINNKIINNKNSNININNNEKLIDNKLSEENKSNKNILIPKAEIDTNNDKGNILNFNNDQNNDQFINVNDNNMNNLNNLNINNISNIKLKDEEIEEEQPSKLNINFVSLNNFAGNKTLRQDIGSLSENNNILRYNNKFNTTRKIDMNNSNQNDRNSNYNFKILNQIEKNDNNNNLYRLENQVEKNDTYNIENKNNKSNDDIKYKNSINIKQDQDMIPGTDDFLIKGDLNDVNANVNVNNNDMKDDFDESDFISIVSKKDILLEKLKKIEEEEKFNKLIEDIFSVRSFKLYILDKFGNGRFDTFIKRYKNGEINKAEVESELNILKELSLKNSKSNNSINVKNKKGSHNKKLRKNNSNRNFIDNNTMNNTVNNVNSLNNMNKFSTEYNYSKTSSNYKKINYEKKVNNINNKEKKINKNEYTGPLNFKNTLRDGDRSSTQINNVSFSNQNKNLTSHSVNSIRARLKSKKL